MTTAHRESRRKKRRRVVLYGDSLVLAGVEASLKHYAQLEVISLDGTRTTAQKRLRALGPNVVIVDVAMIRQQDAVSLLDEEPDLLLIGVDAAGDRLLVLSSTPSHSLSTADLVQVIERQ